MTSNSNQFDIFVKVEFSGRQAGIEIQTEKARKYEDFRALSRSGHEGVRENPQTVATGCF